MRSYTSVAQPANQLHSVFWSPLSIPFGQLSSQSGIIRKQNVREEVEENRRKKKLYTLMPVRENANHEIKTKVKEENV